MACPASASHAEMLDATFYGPPGLLPHHRLDWRGLALVLAGHAAVIGAVLIVRPMAQKAPASLPIVAEIILPDSAPAQPPAAEPELRPVSAELPATPTARAASPTSRAPMPAPQLVVAATDPAAESVPVAAEAEPHAAEAGPPSLASPVARAAPASLAGSPDELRRYLAAIMRQLNRYKTYPRALKKARVEGTVVLEFTIDRDGRLLASAVKQGSGSTELDLAAMEMLARANPLPAIPDFMQRDELALAIPVEYSLITDR